MTFRQNPLEESGAGSYVLASSRAEGDCGCNPPGLVKPRATSIERSFRSKHMRNNSGIEHIVFSPESDLIAARNSDANYHRNEREVDG